MWTAWAARSMWPRRGLRRSIEVGMRMMCWSFVKSSKRGVMDGVCYTSIWYLFRFATKMEAQHMYKVLCYHHIKCKMSGQVIYLRNHLGHLSSTAGQNLCLDRSCLSFETHRPSHSTNINILDADIGAVNPNMAPKTISFDLG